MRIGDVMEFEVDQVVTRQDHMAGLGYSREEGSTLKSRPMNTAVQTAAVQKPVLPPAVAAALKKPAVAVAAPAATPTAVAAPATPVAAPAAPVDASAAASAAAPAASLMDKVKQFTKEKPAVSAAIAVAAIAGVYFLFMRRPPSNPAPAMMPAMAGLGSSHKPKRKKRRKSRKSKK